MAMKIIVNENQFKKILEVEDVIEEQVDVIDVRNALTVVQQKINDIISDPKKEKALLDGVSIKVTPVQGGTYTIQIGEAKYQMQRMARGVHAAIIPAGKGFSAGTVPMTSFQKEIEKIPEFKSLVEKYPQVQSQIQTGKVVGKVYSDRDNQGFFKFTRVRELPERKEMKTAIPITEKYPLGEFLSRNKVNYKFPDGTYGILESGYLIADLVSTQIRIPTQTPKKKHMAPINVSIMNLQDVFNFGDVSFKDEARTGQQIQLFVQQVKGYIEKYGAPFIEHFKNQNPTIYGYASVDGDPNQQIVGDYKPCSGNQIRKEYDLCLSTERAKVIANILNKELPELGGAFQAKGVGQTTQWGPGWTPQSPTIPDQTAPNRRYVLSPMKPYVARA